VTCCVTQLTTCGSYTASLKIEGFHTEHVFTWRPHAHKPSMKVNFHTCIIRFCTLENCEYNIIHRNCDVFFEYPIYSL
jgi:hypothetical protein